MEWQDFNDLTVEDLVSIPGIGKLVAKRIVAMRPYRGSQDLFKVQGLGVRTLKNLGIEKEKKKSDHKKLIETTSEGLQPAFCLAQDTLTNNITFFWRIPKHRRQYM